MKEKSVGAAWPFVLIVGGATQQIAMIGGLSPAAPLPPRSAS